jgi:hypothetical protein
MPDDSFKEFVLDQLGALPEWRYQFNPAPVVSPWTKTPIRKN